MVFFEPARKSQLWLLIPVAVTFVLYHLMIYHLGDVTCVVRASLESNNQTSAAQSITQSKPAASGSSSGSNNALRNIPKKIFMTVKDESRKNSLLRKIKSSGMSEYEIVIMSNIKQSEWIKEHYPKMHSYFINLPYTIQRSDFVRFMVLYHYGGFYLDSDVVLRQPIDEWYSLNDTNGREINVLVGIEADTKKEILPKLLSWRAQQILSWTMAATPRHPFLEHFLSLLLDKLMRPPANRTTYDNDVGRFASPAILTDAVESYLLLRGVKLSDMFDKGGNVFPDDKEDLYLAEVNAFACGTMWSIGAIPCNPPSKRIKAQHMFAGTWKNNPI